MLWCSVALLALFATVQGRAVNISNTWVLPEEGFPVFYRYFRDRISWYEADAVCQFHHANLVTVDTTAQYDAVRAYLKELDISSAVWVGLIRSNPDGDFTWTDYRGLSGDGYWSSAPDARAAPLCAAANPVADYRWEARACGGPTVASFICELPVPQWALGNEGCMVRALPALTILYLPESAAVQLTADCGLAGVKKVQCTGNVKRDDLLRELSCADEDELTSMPYLASTGTVWPVTTDLTYADQETTNEVTTEENITTERVVCTSTSKENIIKESTTSDVENFTLEVPKIEKSKTNKLNRILLNKNINFDVMQSNNLQSNFIPKIANKENMVTNEQEEKLEDEKYMQHKMLHEEIARLGNLENIFTQPTDHFVPPLVMAKAKISDDMTVLSLEEKHAQQLAVKQITKQNKDNTENVSTESPKYNKQIKQSENFQSTKLYDNGKKDKSKSYIPKKYHEKYYDPKGKILKTIDAKSLEIGKTTETPSTFTESITKGIETTTTEVIMKNNKNKNDEEDLSMDLTIMIKDAPAETENKTNYSDDISKIEIIQNITSFNETGINILNDKNVSKESYHVPDNLENVTMAHEIIKITIIAGESSSMTSTVFEITTKTPVFRDNSNDKYTLSSTNFSTTVPNDDKYNVSGTDIISAGNASTTSTIEIEQVASTSAASTYSLSTVLGTTNGQVKNISDAKAMTTTDSTLTTKDEFTTVTTALSHINVTHESDKNLTEDELTSNVSYSTAKEKTDMFNNTELHDMEFEGNFTETDAIDDFQSPLLSAANEPLHRPNRSRRPQPQPNRNKFNPFRILG